MIVFEGRDAAGKGGTIKRITERVSPRVFRVVALPAPTDREKTQVYLQRYIPHFPAAGEVVIFDRSWYNRAGVERVMGFCTDTQYTEFLASTPIFESYYVRQGIILIKYWLSVSQEEQSVASRQGLPMAGRSGSSVQWTWKLTDAGMTIPGPRMQCSKRQIPPMPPGISSTQTIKSERG